MKAKKNFAFIYLEYGRKISGKKREKLLRHSHQPIVLVLHHTTLQGLDTVKKTLGDLTGFTIIDHDGFSLIAELSHR